MTGTSFKIKALHNSCRKRNAPCKLKILQVMLKKSHFLAVLADKTVEDFNYQITFVRTNKAFQNSSYDEIIEYLKPMYAKLEKKTCLDAVQSPLRDGTVTVKDRI